MKDNLDDRVDSRMREVQGYIIGLRSGDPVRMCLLIEFCYLLELHQQAVDLHASLNRSEVEPDWLRRVDAMVRVSKMKL